MPEMDAGAAQLKRELTELLSEAGRRFGFDVVLEYRFRRGRLDVAWTWSPDALFPGLTGSVPVVGFEIDASWRTRKHVTGDLLNLQDAGVALGVIVLAGTDVKDDGLRRFAEVLVDRPGPKVLIWTADYVRALAGLEESPPPATTSAAEGSRTPDLPPEPGSPSAPPSRLDGGHSGKYANLYRWLRSQGGESLTVKFAQRSRRRSECHCRTRVGSMCRTGTATTGLRLREPSSTLIGRPRR